MGYRTKQDSVGNLTIMRMHHINHGVCDDVCLLKRRESGEGNVESKEKDQFR